MSKSYNNPQYYGLHLCGEERKEIKGTSKIYKKPDGGSTMKKTKARRDQRYKAKRDCKFNQVGQKSHTDNMHLNKDLKEMRD